MLCVRDQGCEKRIGLFAENPAYSDDLTDCKISYNYAHSVPTGSPGARRFLMAALRESHWCRALDGATLGVSRGLMAMVLAGVARFTIRTCLTASAAWQKCAPLPRRTG
jgi:hypothetical protein